MTKAINPKQILIQPDGAALDALAWILPPAQGRARRLSAAYNATMELSVDALEADVVARLITAATAAASALGKYAPDLLEPDDEAALDLLEAVLTTIKHAKETKMSANLIPAETGVAFRLRTATPDELQKAVGAVRVLLANGRLPVRPPLKLTPQAAAEVNAIYLFDLYPDEIVAQLPVRPAGRTAA